MKKIRTGLALLIVLGFISILVGGVGNVFGNPDGVTDNFDNENYIASKTNLVVSGGQVKLEEAPAEDPMCATCTCEGGSYQTITCSGDTVYVDCNYDKCWSPTVGRRNWSSASGYCSGLTRGGYSDWSLPDINTLRNLCNSGSCSNLCFGGEGDLYSRYWSSTEERAGRHYYSLFRLCSQVGSANSDTRLVRCVR